MVSDNHGNDLFPLIQWTAPTSQNYYVEVSSADPAGGGTYEIRMTDELTPQSQPEHGGSPSGATTVPPPATVQGNINVPGEEDWFKFDAIQGSTYRIDTSLLSLPDSVLYLVHTDQQTVVDFNDDDSGQPSSAIIWTADASATYYVKVVGKNPDSHSGTYRLGITSPGGWRRCGRWQLAGRVPAAATGRRRGRSIRRPGHN